MRTVDGAARYRALFRTLAAASRDAADCAKSWGAYRSNSAIATSHPAARHCCSPLRVAHRYASHGNDFSQSTQPSLTTSGDAWAASAAEASAYPLMRQV